MVGPTGQHEGLSLTGMVIHHEVKLQSGYVIVVSIMFYFHLKMWEGFPKFGTYESFIKRLKPPTRIVEKSLKNQRSYDRKGLLEV